MTWIRLDDGITDNLKIVRVGPLGFALHVSAIVWCGRNLTDGFVPTPKVYSLIDTRTPVGLTPTTATVDVDGLVSALVAAGLWEPTDGGYQLHDYLEFNPSKEQVLRRRESDRKRFGRYYEKANGRANAVRNAVANTVSPSDPVPVPVPNSRQEEREGAANAGPVSPAPPAESFTLTPESKNSNLEASKGKARKPAKPRVAVETPCPADFAPNDGNYECGSKLGFTHARVDELLEEMRDAYASKGRTYANWHAAFNTFMRNQAKWERERASARPARVDTRQPAVPGRTWKTNTLDEVDADV